MTATVRLLIPRYNFPTNAYEATCARCGRLAFSMGAEVVALNPILKVPVFVPHNCLGDEDD